MKWKKKQWFFQPINKRNLKSEIRVEYWNGLLLRNIWVMFFLDWKISSNNCFKSSNDRYRFRGQKNQIWNFTGKEKISASIIKFSRDSIWLSNIISWNFNINWFNPNSNQIFQIFFWKLIKMGVAWSDQWANLEWRYCSFTRNHMINAISMELFPCKNMASVFFCPEIKKKFNLTVKQCHNIAFQPSLAVNFLRIPFDVKPTIYHADIEPSYTSMATFIW